MTTVAIVYCAVTAVAYAALAVSQIRAARRTGRRRAAR